MIKKTVFFSVLFALSAGCISYAKKNINNDSSLQATQLFNGKDINDWTPKIRTFEAGENFANTFRVEDGLLKVRYDGYDKFNFRYGHLAYKTPYSYYVLRIEYRFVEEQAQGGESWAWRNSGVMLHGQDPKTMLTNQDFPISIEAQFLGGNGTTERTTSNLCTPGTHVVIANELYTTHCKNSTSKTYHGDQWVTAEFVVLGDSVIRHILDGEIVMEYSRPQYDGGNISFFDNKIIKNGDTIKDGYIYLQSESHPIDFRKVEIYDLDKFKNDPKSLEEKIIKILE